MFTDFVGPPLGEDTINILFYFHTGIKQTMFANSNILFMDLIDIFYKRNANLYNIFNIVFLFNGKIIDNYMNLSLTQIGFQDGSHIEVIDIENII